MRNNPTLQLSEFSLADMIECGADIRQMGHASQSEDEFCNRLVNYLGRRLVNASDDPAAVLTRIFRTCSLCDLPPDLQRMARTSDSLLADRTKCLRLLATAGLEPAWNDVSQSALHQVIPLPSASAVRSLPMIAQLFEQLGFDIKRVFSPSGTASADPFSTGVFYVENARGSQFIPAQQSFVLKYGIRSVIGYGDVFPNGHIFAVLIFSRVHIAPTTAQLFSHLSLSTQVAMLPHVAGAGVDTSTHLTSSLTNLISNYERIVLDQESQLRDVVDATQAANRAKSEFLANMSHEIRTPMTAILGYADLLIASLDDQESIEAAETVKRNGEFLLSVINDILDLSKIEAGKLEAEIIPVSPHELIADVISLMQVRSTARGLRLKASISGAIPETIHTDPTRVRQILLNVIGNAIKFTETGWVELNVHMSDEDHPRICFRVTDTGIGIPVSAWKYVFQPFSQSDNSTTRKFGGTGLGLTITKRLVEILGGTITFTSSEQEGTTFTIFIPTGSLAGVAMVEGTRQLATANEPPRDIPTTASLSGRILLAEDGPDNQRLIAFLLRKAGAAVDIAENGKVAVEMAKLAVANGSSYRAILMDMQMPVMDGYTATRKLRASGHREPIIALTAHAMSGDQAKCLAAGCTAYATKPIRQQTLIQLVAQYCTDTVGVSCATD